MREYTKNDCDQTGYGIPLKGKAVVVDRAALPPEHPGQLFLCMGGNGAGPDPAGRDLLLVLRPIFYDLQLPWLIVADLPDIMT